MAGSVLFGVQFLMLLLLTRIAPSTVPRLMARMWPETVDREEDAGRVEPSPPDPEEGR